MNAHIKGVALRSALAFAVLSAAAGGDQPAVYPAPRETRASGGVLALSAAARVTGADTADEDAVLHLRGLLATAPRDIRIDRFAAAVERRHVQGAAAAWEDGRLETSAPLPDRQAFPIPPCAMHSAGFRPDADRMTNERVEVAGTLVEPPDFLAGADYDWSWSNDAFKAPEFHEKAIDPFLGAPRFEQQQLFEGGRLPNVVVALDGSVVAGWGGDRVVIRRSEDGGKTWLPETELCKGIMGGGLTVDEVSGDLLAFAEDKHPPAPRHLFRSKDHGETWAEQPFVLHPNSLGHTLSLSMNEHGITIRRGRFKGRLIRPARWYGRMIYRKDFGTHYTSAIFSDDGGTTWMSAEPFPEWGTGEACIAELSDGTLHYNTRRHWAPRPEDALWRYTAESRDGGATWMNVQRSKVLPDGHPSTTYGLMGGLVRLPVLGRDILLFSNIVHPTARMNGHVWASFDGGRSWPVRRQVFEGGFAYSTLDAGRPGTPSEGWICLLYEGGPQGGGTFARFNLSWVLDGEATGDGDVPAWANVQRPSPSVEPSARTGNLIHGAWEARAWRGGEHAQWSDRAPGRSGKLCWSIRSEQGADTAWTTVATVQPERSYELSGWIKTRGVLGAAGALLNIQNRQDVRTEAVTGDSDWTFVATHFLSTAVTNLEINCLFGGWGTSTGEAWYDDVRLAEVDAMAAGEATVRIDPAAPAVPYSPMIFGGFLEHFDTQVYGGVFDPLSPLSDTNGFRRDVIEALKELRVPVVRWPGGCFVSGYRWERGVGKERTPADDKVWGVVEPNTFGTDEFVELSRRIGWTPYICNSAGDGAIEETRNWLEYCNGRYGPYAERRKAHGSPEPRNVPIWSIGNENYGAWEIGQKTIDQWAPLVRDAARAMREVDPDVKLSAAATASRDWALPLLRTAGPYLDYISIHGYGLPLWERNDSTDYLTCILRSGEPEKEIVKTIGLLDEAGHRGRIKIAYDEWNLRAWHHPGFPRKTVQNCAEPEVSPLIAARKKSDVASQYTMADALFSASFFNACRRHAGDVGMANIAPLVNTRGPLFVHPQGLVRRTHFHAMAIYAHELEPRVGRLDLEADPLFQGNHSIPVADAIATVDDSGRRWAIALVNRDPARPLHCTVMMKGRPLEGGCAAVELAGDSPDAFNSIEQPDRVVPVEKTVTFADGVVALPPHSLTVVRLAREPEATP